MALFQGEEMVDVTTPDGRTLTLPRSIVPASMVQQPQQIATAPPAGAFGAPGAPAQPVQEAPQPTLMPPEPQADENVVESPLSVVEAGEPETRRVTAQQLRKEQTAQQRAQEKARKQQLAYEASPEGQRANVQARQDATVQNEAAAVYGAADLQAAEDETVGRAIEKRNEQLDDLYVKRAEEARANLEAEDAKTSEIVALRKKIAGTKIDRSADHPVMLAISAALVGLGQAMNGEKITSYDVIVNAIDRKVAAQEADLDRMGKVYGMTKDELDMLKDKSKSRLEFHNAMIAAETDKAIRHIEEITARTASEKTKANAKVIVAQLQARAADKSAEAMRWGLEFDQKEKHQKDQLRMQGAQLAQADRHHKDNLQLKREEMYLDWQKALAADRARGDQATFEARMKAQEDVSKRGVRDMNGDLYLTADGRAKMERAAKFEEEAKAIEAQGAMTAEQAKRVELLRQNADVLRGDAQSFDVVKAHSDTEAITVSNMIASGQSVVQLIDGIKDLAGQVGRGAIARDAAQSKLQAMFQQLKPGLKEAWQLGAWDKGSAGLVETIIGADPSSEWNAGVLGTIVGKKMYEDPDAFGARLDSVAEELENKAKNRLIGIGTKFGKDERVLRRAPGGEFSESATKLSAARSGLEIEKDADQAGVVASGGRRAYQAIWNVNAPSVGQEAEGAASSAKYPGLSRAQVAPFEERLQAYKRGDKKAGEELVRTVAEAAAKRPDFVIPLLHNLREHAGDKGRLYMLARSAVPKGSVVDEQMTYEEQARIGTAGEAPDMLAATVLNSIKDDGTVGDKDGYRELARRAGAGDQVAKKAIASIVAASGSRRARIQYGGTTQEDARRIDKAVKTAPFKTGGR